ncbi:Protein of unknown function [Pyronema omphalodes CBS 100304]|uniref:Uncharacterized protein n=1 Tax=Pyronema omphalodes (strain CBS 100304) TaxID=1076935 RepID=U4LBB5_PYROM|nr:Protein of unknown function [Pyronema omphalodes CBS 100304]
MLTAHLSVLDSGAYHFTNKHSSRPLVENQRVMKYQTKTKSHGAKPAMGDIRSIRIRETYTHFCGLTAPEYSPHEPRTL